MKHCINSVFTNFKVRFTVAKRQQTNIQALFLTVALVASSLLFCGPAGAQDNPDQPGVKYDLLFISHGPDGEEVHVSTRSNGNRRKTVYKDKSASDAIDWAIRRGRVTAILKGDYLLSRIIKITRDQATLIVPPDVRLAYKSDKITRPTIPIIKVVRADNCRIFTFGTLDQIGTEQEAVFFQGHRSDGKPGINGGLLFGTSEVRNMGSAYIVIGAENIHMPLAMGSDYGQMLVGCEACYDMTIGTLAGLGTKKGPKEGELIDLNAFNKNVRIDRVIGSAPMVGDEIIDCNHGHNVTINRFQAFFGTGRPGRNPVGLDMYPSPGYHDWTNRRKILGGGFQESKNVFVKYMERNNKKVAAFNRDVTLPGYPDSLPELTIKVNLSVDFEDGTTQTLIDNKLYRYDLSKDLDLAPAAVRLW